MQLLAANRSCPRCRAIYRRPLARCPRDGARLEPLPTEPLVGEVIEEYRIERAIGDGSSGRLYLGRAVDDRTCAIRVLFGEHAAAPRYCRRLEREAILASRFEHPNVVRVLGAGLTETGLPYLMTEYVNGSSLQQIIDADAPLRPDRIVHFMTDILEGLAHIHEQGVIHRNLHPTNIRIWQRDGEQIARITGFGSAISAERAQSAGTESPDKIVGSTAHAAPERLERKPFDHRADLFSAGVILYEMLCGRAPFEGTDLVIATKIIACDPPAIEERVSGLKADWRLEALAYRLMQKSPGRRFDSAELALGALEVC